MRLLVALGAAVLFAQQTDQLSRIEGRVVDASSDLPVAGARVIAMRIDGKGSKTHEPPWKTQPSAGEQDPDAGQVAVLTGSDGRFRLLFEGPVNFALWVDDARYAEPQWGMSPDNMFEAKPDAPKTDIVLKLVPAASVAGRLIDADTKEPLPDFWVLAERYQSGGSRRRLMPAGEGKTGKDGRFSLDRATPGDCLLSVHPPVATKIGVAKPVEDFRHAVQKGYEAAWYPGVDSVEQAVPLHLAAGAHVEGVEIGISKKRVASIRGRVLGDGNAAKAEAHLSLTRVTRAVDSSEFSSVAYGEVHLGSEFEIANLPPGTYHLSAQFGSDKATAKYAVITIEVGEENQDGLDLYLTRGVVVTGRVRIEGREDNPDKPALPADDVQVRLAPLIGSTSEHDRAAAPVASKDGGFRVEGVIPSSYRLLVLSTPRGYAVSEVRYNGALCEYGVVAVEAGAAAQRLEIKLAPANSSVLATVTDGDQPAAGAMLLLVPAGADRADIAVRPRHPAADLGGQRRPRHRLRPAAGDLPCRSLSEGRLLGRRSESVPAPLRRRRSESRRQADRDDHGSRAAARGRTVATAATAPPLRPATSDGRRATSLFAILVFYPCSIDSKHFFWTTCPGTSANVMGSTPPLRSSSPRSRASATWRCPWLSISRASCASRPGPSAARSPRAWARFPASPPWKWPATATSTCASTAAPTANRCSRPAEPPAEAAGKIIVEHTNINPNKAAHIGHLRNAVLGDTFVRMLRARGRRVEVQNYIDNTGVQVADVVVGFHFLEQKTAAEVEQLILDGALRLHLLGPLRARRHALPATTRTRSPGAPRRCTPSKPARARSGRTRACWSRKPIVRCHLATMLRLGIVYDVLPRESEILHLKFWATAFELLKERQAIYLETEGKNAGCWVMPAAAFSRRHRQRGQQGHRALERHRHLRRQGHRLPALEVRPARQGFLLPPVAGLRRAHGLGLDRRTAAARRRPPSATARASTT